MFLDGRWYRLTIRPELVPSERPGRSRLPITLLTRNVIEPLFGIIDPRTDKRIDFVGGGRGLGELERRVTSGEMAAAFALYPTQMDDLMAVADAGEIMPPKSTWFEPKLADGMVSHVPRLARRERVETGVHIETDRLVLRDWRDEDAEPFAGSTPIRASWSSFRSGSRVTESDGLMARMRRFIADHGYGQYAVEERGTGDFIGYVGLCPVTFEAAFAPATEIGWRLARGPGAAATPRRALAPSSTMPFGGSA